MQHTADDPQGCRFPGVVWSQGAGNCTAQRIKSQATNCLAAFEGCALMLNINLAITAARAKRFVLTNPRPARRCRLKSR
jgi:hypothetical protein